MKILHLIIDHQVVERTMGIYEEVFPGCNDFILFDLYKRTPKHIHNLSFRIVVKDNNGYTMGKSFDFTPYTHIIAHFMTMDAIEFIKNAPSSIHVCWEVYGADLYDQFLMPFGMELYYGEIYKYSKYRLIHKYLPIVSKIMSFLKGRKYVFKYQKERQFRYISNRVNSIQYCCKYDASYIEKYSGRTIPNYEIFNYSLTNVLGDLKDTSFTISKNIMIGNSASLSNNHLYVLDKMRNMKLENDVKIIMPISYGGNQQYISEIESNYKRVFNNNEIVFLKDYLPLHEYNKIFTDLNVIILSAWRQESQGTAIMGFYLGVKVFMSERSPLYKWFKDCGFIVFALENAMSDDFVTTLSYNEKQHNRSIVIDRYNEDAFAKTLRENIQ